MKTAPCPRCGREVLRDGAVGLLVCSCGEILEFPQDLEGPIRPKEHDRRWFGTDEERQDLAELGLPTPVIPRRNKEIEELQRRAAENEAQERSRLEHEQALAEAAYQRLLPPPVEGSD